MYNMYNNIHGIQLFRHGNNPITIIMKLHEDDRIT